MKEKGITIIELAVVIFIVGLFAVISISDFPKIQKGFALSRTAHKLAQDIKRAQDLSLSGVRVFEPTYGYGVYLSAGKLEYVIYDDINPSYFGYIIEDNVVDTIIVDQEKSGVFIKEIVNEVIGNKIGSAVSINFTPPDPIINITDEEENVYRKIGIILGLKSDSSVSKIIWVNTSGLIDVQ